MKNQCIGIDCGKQFHVASLGQRKPDGHIQNVSSLKFNNSKSGFIKLNRWIKKNCDEHAGVVLEATGVYHETLACFLVDHGFYVSVVLPNRARYFAKTLKIKTVTDKVSAESLATMGLEKKLDRWNKPDPLFNHLRQLTRERDQLIQERTAIKCQLHAETSGAWPNRESIKRMKHRIVLINKQKGEVESEIKKIIDTNEEIKNRIQHPASAIGVGLITAATVLAETNGFALIRNKKQLVSYAGLDVVEKQSGISVRGKSRISHHGNKYLRKCLHFPALTAIKHSAEHKTLFVRLVSKHGIKMKAAVAVQRKLLVLIYTLWKNKTFYDPEFEIKKSRNELGQSRRTAPMELA